jgi:hypothetical protein
MGLFRRRTPPRPAVADLSTAMVDVDGQQLSLAEALVAARVVGAGLSVVVHHPRFADLLEEQRARTALEMVEATLGEDLVPQVVVELSPAVHSPIDPFTLEQLREFVRSLGIAVEPAPGEGGPVAPDDWA